MISFYIFLLLFLLSWAISFLPQIRVYLPEGKFHSFKILYTAGASFLCFCFLQCSREEGESSMVWKGVAVHEFVHQKQQRWLSPLLFGLFYFGEWLFRKYILHQSWMTAYENLIWEKQAERARFASLQSGKNRFI